MGRCPMCILLCVVVAVILIGDLFGWREPVAAPFYGKGAFVARVLEIKESQTSGYIAVSEIDSVNGKEVTPFKMRLHFIGETPRLTAGQAVWFSAKSEPLASVPEVPDIVDLQASMRRKGVVGSMTVVMDSIRAVGDIGGINAALLRANDRAMTRLMRCPLSAESIDMLAAMLLGKADMITTDTRDLYSAAGLSHLLALSGMHVGIIIMIFSFALFPFYLLRQVRLRLVCLIIALWCYAAFTAFSPSVTRAVIMASVYMAARCLERQSQPLNSLCLAAVLILIFSPEALYAAGFQMSFAAVAGIILFFPQINRVDRHAHPKLYKLASYPALSIAAMLFTGLIAAYHFHTFPIYFILANLVVVPLLPLFIVSGLVSMIFNITGATDILANIINRVAEFVATIPGALVEGVYPPMWLVITLCVLMAVLGVALNGKHRFWSIEAAMLMVFVIIIAIVKPAAQYPDHEEYLIEEKRSVQLIVRDKSTCTIYTTLQTEPDRKDLQERYKLLLRDFMAKRKVDSLTVVPMPEFGN